MPRVVRVAPARSLADVLSKGWVESLIPFVALLCVIAGILATTDDYFGASNLRNLAQYAADGGLVVLAHADRRRRRRHRPVGRIELRHVGLRGALLLPHPAACRSRSSWWPALATGAAIGVVNGTIAGLLGCGALLTTLGTMITTRGLYTLASQAQLVEISSSGPHGRSLGLDRVRQGADLAGRLLGACRRRGPVLRHVPADPLRLACAGRRRQPQGRAPWRHPRQDDDLLRLCAGRPDRRPRRLPVCRAAEQRRRPTPASAWSSSC